MPMGLPAWQKCQFSKLALVSTLFPMGLARPPNGGRGKKGKSCLSPPSQGGEERGNMSLPALPRGRRGGPGTEKRMKAAPSRAFEMGLGEAETAENKINFVPCRAAPRADTTRSKKNFGKAVGGHPERSTPPDCKARTRRCASEQPNSVC